MNYLIYVNPKILNISWIFSVCVLWFCCEIPAYLTPLGIPLSFLLLNVLFIGSFRHYLTLELLKLIKIKMLKGINMKRLNHIISLTGKCHEESNISHIMNPLILGICKKKCIQ